MAKLIFGCGYLGLRVAHLWLAANEPVFAVTRSPAKAADLTTRGIRPIVADIGSAAQVSLPQDVSTVLFAVGFDRASQQSVREVYVGGLSRSLSWMPKTVDRFLYISSTGVYGQASREEVDEDTPCRPTREGGKACLDAEELLAGSEFGAKTVVLRLAGLYGPERIPRWRDLAAGKPIDAPAEGWLNLIHVDDAARITVLADARAELPRTYVVSDGHPVQRRDYYAQLARLVGAPEPQFVTPAADSPAAIRAGSDKRVQPRRMFEELGVKLMYPDYRVGLAAIVKAEGLAES